ncbi:MAG: DNA repair protein RadA [Bacteroidaceae bacterium]|nr:DNA repair protein RadA [Bacteroidaceae bacterium]
MAKTGKTVYVCNSCGEDQPKWFGRCPVCGEWNTCVEQVVYKPTNGQVNRSASASYTSPLTSTPLTLAEIETTSEIRLNTHDEELNRVLGGGLVQGSLILLGGEPGIGKSTLVLQTVLHMPERCVLYVSGEESASQIKMRAERLLTSQQVNKSISQQEEVEQPQRDNFHHYKTADSLKIFCETNLEKVLEQIKAVQPELIIVDSIQTIWTETAESSPGSITQIRECAATILKVVKESGIPAILIGHITKEGSLAGPKVLEHIVDAVLQFEGDQHYMYRILRAQKNRFGSTAELGIYEMRQDGLRQVSNPSELLLTDRHEGMSGVCIAAAVEGVRPFLIEVQALVSTAAYGTPQRSATGFDLRRMNMLLAVLEKRVGFKLAQKDVYLNIAGGLRVSDPAIDLSVITAVLSSNLDVPVDPAFCMTGEVGLSGEIRPVSRIEQRIREAAKLGFHDMLIPSSNAEQLKQLQTSLPKGITLHPVRKVEEAFRTLFG